MSRSLIWLNPGYLILSYVRTLNGWQVLSWIVWLLLVLFVISSRKHRRRTLKHPLFKWGLAGLLASLYVGGIGLNLLLKAQPLLGYNEIFAENGRQFLWGGIAFALYTAFLLWKYRKQKIQEKR